ncbi:MAG: catalase [Clostridia bacterium]|nr:catalase [Clostridia bacterium]
MNSFFGHLNTVLAHKRLVFYHARKIGIPFQGFMHDMSKFSPMEFPAGVKYYAGGKRSPNEIQREKFGYSQAWLHHKGVNKHHFEYWTDYNPKEKCVMPVKMPYKYVLEMLCDRLAASKVYQGKNYTDSHPLEYFQNGKAKRVIHPDTSDAIESLLLMIKDKGEKYTLDYIKHNRKELEKKYNN